MADDVTAAELFSLHGQVAIVTGATTGLGRETARLLASAGATTVLSGLASEHPERVAAQLAASGLPIVGRVCDVSSAEEVTALVDAAHAEFGRIDTVFANAGISLEDRPSDLSSDEKFDRMFDVNVRSVLHLAACALPRMAAGGGGAFIIMSSLAGIRGNTKIPVYGLTKAANAQLARNLAVEWGPSGIRVNSIAPGVIQTDFAKVITEGPHREARLAKTPMRRFGEPYHVAGTVLWLASAAGSFTSGQNIVVDGGTVIGD